jgi:formylglycine-generating enzyme required for sulfatase activity
VWGEDYGKSRANIANIIRGVSSVWNYPSGDGHFGMSDFSGNAMEWTDSKFRIYDGKRASQKSVVSLAK